jgi:putative peptidoglycan lipid II flippase
VKAPPPKPPQFRKAALITSVASILVRISGFLRDIIFSGFFGAGAVADAYYAALRAPNLFRELFAEGTLSNIVVPLFAESSESDGQEQAYALINAILGVLLLLLGGITGLLLAFPELFVQLIASGYDQDPEKFTLTATLVQWLSPFLMGLSVASLFAGMLNVKGRFFLPTLAPSVFNIAIIIACFMSDFWESATGQPPIVLITIAASASGFLSAAIQYPTLRRLGFRFRPNLKPHPKLKEALKFGAAAVIGVTVVQFNLIVETQLASMLGDGPVSHLTLSFRFIQIPQGIVASSIAIALLAQLSILFASKNIDDARSELQRAIHLNNTLVFPSAVGLYILAEPLVALTFEHGAFTAEDTLSTASALRGYAVAAIGICLYRILLPVFFAQKDPYTPMKLAIGIAIIKLPAAYGLLEAYGLIGLPLSHALTVGIEVSAMVWILNKKLGICTQGFATETLKIILASALMGVAIIPCLPFASGVMVFVVSGFGMLIYGLVGLAIRIESVSTVKNKIIKRLRPPKP